MFHFNTDDGSGISDIIGLDLVSANTDVVSVDTLPIFFNKVYRTDLLHTADSLYFIPNVDPLTSSWNNPIYRMYDTETTFTNNTGR